MINLNWDRDGMTPQKIGAFGENYAKMIFTSYGAAIYTSEIDDHGIDFIAETEKGIFKFQVKTVRTNKTNYVFMKQKYFSIDDPNLFLLLILLTNNEKPDSYIIPANAWKNHDGFFVDRKYEGKKSQPEYGLNLSKKNMPKLESYRCAKWLEEFFDAPL